MSATANNVGAGSSEASASTPPPRRGSSDDDGRNALQGLLAFACIHQQAVRRRRETLKSSSPPSPRFSREEELALDEILQLVAARAIAITGADGVAIALAKDQAIVCRASTGEIAPDPGARLDPASGFSGACLLGGDTVRCDDSEDDPRVNAAACRALGARSMIAVPLCAKRRVVGLVEAFSAEPHGFNESDVKSLNLLGELILSAIRPEEEHHLAAMAKEILPELPPRKMQEAPAETVAGPASAKMLVDEKFVPATASPGAVSQAPPTGENQQASPLQLPSSTAANPEPVKIAATIASPAGIEAPGEAPREKHPFLSFAATAAAVLVALALLGALVWKGQHLTQAISADTQASEVGRTLNTPPRDTADAQSRGEALPVSAESPAPPLNVGTTAQVTGIRHASTADASTVVVELEDQVQYEAHSLDNPARIYFDLHDTKLSAALENRTIGIDDAFLKRVRVAQPVDGITRVVLETKNQPDFSVSLDTNPYRLTIQVHKTGVVAASTLAVTRPAVPPPNASAAISASPKPPSPSSEPSTAAETFQVVLDAGHGGWDLGTVGRKGLLEKDLVLDIVQRLGSLLESKLGASITYTRSDDSYLPLEKRAEIANLTRADLFLSVHANYSDISTARGVETYYTNTYSSVKARSADGSPALEQVNWNGVVDIRAKVMDSRRLAADIQQALYNGLAARNPQLSNRGVKEAQYVVLTGTQMPAVLAEVSFVSSPADEDKLQSSEYRRLIAEALYKGVVKYRDEMRRAKVARLQAASR
jgi:N-acetylmuramoyl-L-alanine amidase